MSKDSEKENTQWNPSIKTEERMPVTVRLFHIPYNMLPPSSLVQLKTFQRAAANLVKNLLECPHNSRKKEKPTQGQSPTGR